MNYLLEENALTIEPTLAKAIGLNESIFLRQLHYWLNKTKHIVDGRKWVFNTSEQWCEQFPFWSKSTLKRIIKSLKEENWIETEHLDKNLLNRTNWYTINYEKINKLAKTLEDKREKENEELAKKPPNEGADNFSEEFKIFWKHYPRKFGGQKLAFEEFKKLNEEDRKLAIFGAEKYATQTEGFEYKYIKTAKAWLKDQYYIEYDQTQAEQTSPKTSLARVLSDKINILLSQEELQIVPIWEQIYKDKNLFSTTEQDILKNIGNTIEDYKDMEFQKGQIYTFLQGFIG